jgi:cytochrome c oxidase subunit III
MNIRFRRPSVPDERVHPAHQFYTLEQQHEASTLGMWVFLATEIMVFGVLFTGYAAYRAEYALSFAAASRHLDIRIGATNTVVLLTSSLTMALAVYAARLGQKKWLVRCLILTALLGTLFMVFKAVEYYEDYRDHLVPRLGFDAEAKDWAKPVNPKEVELFLMFYYIMTGLHALHLTIGIALMAIIAYLAWRGAYSPEYYSPVEVAGLYWHFVDLIWIFLLPLLYLIGTRSGP